MILGLTSCGLNSDASPTELTHDFADEPQIRSIEKVDFDAVISLLSEFDLDISQITVLSDIQAIYLNDKLVAAVVPINDREFVSVIKMPDEAYRFISGTTDTQDSHTFKNLHTGEIRTYSQSDLTSNDMSLRMEIEQFINNGKLISCGTVTRESFTNDVKVTPQALDPQCYDDCMRGAVPTCAGTCAPALLVPPQPVTYIACNAACLSTWHATCTIGCDTNTF